jgi:HSP20 family protein
MARVRLRADVLEKDCLPEEVLAAKRRIAMQLTRWDPFREMEELSDRLGRSWPLGFMRPFGRHEGGEEALVVADWAPLVDVEETDQEYLIKAELPEVRKEDVKVTIENGMLTIEGDRKREKEEKTRKVHRVERSYGKFVRRFSVPPEVEDKKVAAEFKDGVLYVHVPKSPVMKPKAIEVKVA